MKDRQSILPIEEKQKYDTELSLVNYQTQEVILNPFLSGEYKDSVLEDAIVEIKKIGERRAIYVVQHDTDEHAIYESK